MSDITSLLNPTPSEGDGEAHPPEERRDSLDQTMANTTTYEAAAALTTLATLGSGQQYAPTRELPSPTTSMSAARRHSSFGSLAAAPVEPLPPIDQPQPHSPTLDQYHHTSKSPEEQRRRSLLAMATSPTILAPIQSLTASLSEQVHQDPSQVKSEYGKDVSQMVDRGIRSGDGGEGRDHTQDREPGFIRDEPTTTQIRKPDASTQATPVTGLSLEPQQSFAYTRDSHRIPSPPLPLIKPEPAGTRETTPSTTLPQQQQPPPLADDAMPLDPGAREALEVLKAAELGLRQKKKEPSAGPAPAPGTVPAPGSEARPAPPKKRSAPKSAAANKKGTAAKKPTTKKRKLEGEAQSDNARRSGTPASLTSKGHKSTIKKGSQAGTPAGSSPAPDHSSDDEGESSDDGKLYCICRKPDNHRWMIGCDGGCEDWFHGECVSMVRADENLIDKFICPNCERDGKGQTTWKPMCRHPNCRQPARLGPNELSKYCSEECGVDFFRGQLPRTAGGYEATRPQGSGKKPRKKAIKEEVEHGSEEETEPVPLGGVLRASDVRALTLQSKNVEAFQRLGTGILTPPQTASLATNGVPSPPEGNPLPSHLDLTDAEKTHILALQDEKKDLEVRLEMLKDRERFVSLLREHAHQLAERAKLKPKEFCGYDSRLVWSDTEFSRWRNTKSGKAALQFGTLTPSPEQIASIDGPDDEDEEMDLVNGDRVLNGEDKERENRELVCVRKRCQKHAQWQKLNLQDARFEELEVVEAIKACEKEERTVKDKAARRIRKDAVVGQLTEGTGVSGQMTGLMRWSEKNRDGWAELVA